MDILAQVTNDLLFGAGGATVGTGVLYWLITRQVKKVVNHCDDRKIHIEPDTTYVEADPDDGFVKESHCTTVSKYREEKINDNKKAIVALHRRFDDMVLIFGNIKTDIIKEIKKKREES